MSALPIFMTTMPLFAEGHALEEKESHGYDDCAETGFFIWLQGQEELYQRLNNLEERDEVPCALYSDVTLENLRVNHAPDNPEEAWVFAASEEMLEDRDRTDENPDWLGEDVVRMLLAAFEEEETQEEGESAGPASEGMLPASTPDLVWGINPLKDGTGSLYVRSFEGNGKPIRVEVPEKVGAFSVSRIGEGCFTGMQDVLVGVVLPDSVCSIGAEAFAGCRKLRSINLPESLKEIGDAAFAGTGISRFAGLTGHPVFEIKDGVLFARENHRLVAYPPASVRSVYDVPEGTKSIQKGAFAGNESLQCVNLPASVTGLTADAFSDTRIRRLKVAKDSSAFMSINGVLYRKPSSGKNPEILVLYPPGREAGMCIVRNSVRVIENQAFLGAAHLKQVFLPEGLIRIGSAAFCGCSKLESIKVPGSVQYVGSYAFSGCSSLKKADLSAGVLLVEDGLFFGCSALEEVDLPAGYSVIGELDLPDGCIVSEKTS